MRTLTLLAALAFALATPAHAFGPEPRLRVTQEPNGDFTVQYDSRARLTDYWCAAGNFVTNTLRMPDRTRVFRQSPPPRKAGQGIRFTLDASRSAGDTGITTFGGPQDGSMLAGGVDAAYCVNRSADRP